MSSTGVRRPQRRCVERKTKVPSASHYLGYVEDGETPEMIMKKFEELEKVMCEGVEMQNSIVSTSGAGPDQGGGGDDPTQAGPGCSHRNALTEEQMEQLFQQTSVYNMKMVASGNTVLVDGGNLRGGVAGPAPSTRRRKEANESDDEEPCRLVQGGVAGFWSDEDEEENNRHWEEVRQKRERLALGEKLTNVPRKRQAIVTHFNAETQSLIRRHVWVPDQGALLHQRVPPPPIPRSWGRNVLQYNPDHSLRRRMGCRQADAAATGTAEAGEEAVSPRYRTERHVVPDITSFDTEQLRRRPPFLAALINTGWELDPDRIPATRRAAARSLTVTSRLWELPVPQLVPLGFVFVFAHKTVQAQVHEVLMRWGYCHVDNIAVVHMQPNNRVLCLKQRGICQSHTTIFIFRKRGMRPFSAVLWHTNAPRTSTPPIRQASFSSFPQHPGPAAPEQQMQEQHSTVRFPVPPLQCQRWYRMPAGAQELMDACLGRDIELRHQRNPDVIFAAMQAAPGRPWAVPEEVYFTIETLLPTGMGAFLELFSAADANRPGWTHISERCPS